MVRGNPIGGSHEAPISPCESQLVQDKYSAYSVEITFGGCFHCHIDMRTSASVLKSKCQMRLITSPMWDSLLGPDSM